LVKALVAGGGRLFPKEDGKGSHDWAPEDILSLVQETDRKADCGIEALRAWLGRAVGAHQPWHCSSPLPLRGPDYRVQAYPS
jgi:hypothetical protein